MFPLSPAMITLGLRFLGVLAIVGALAWGYHAIRQSGYDERDSECKATDALRDAADAEAHAKALADAKALELAYTQIDINQATIAAQKQRKAEIDYRQVIVRRTQYAKRPDAGKCSIPAEFVRTVDAFRAADSGMPEEAPTSSGVDDGPTGITDTELLSYTTDLKDTCANFRKSLLEWKAREQDLQRAEKQFRTQHP